MDKPQVTREQKAVLLCVNDLCKKEFEVNLPKPNILNGVPFCTIIYGQPPVQCPFCKQTYVFRITNVPAMEFGYGAVETPEGASRIVLPHFGPS